MVSLFASRLALVVAIVASSASLTGCVAPLSDLPETSGDGGGGGGGGGQTDGAVVTPDAAPVADSAPAVADAGDGAAPPTDGAVSPTDGAVSPTDGAVSPTDGAVSPTDGSVTPPSDGGPGADASSDAGPRDCTTLSCGTGGTCQQGDAGPSCVCSAGYVLNGGTCVDADECAGATNPCGTGTCVNEPGTYACRCGAGYRVGTVQNATTCVDVDECVAPSAWAGDAGVADAGSTDGGAWSNPCGAGTCSNTQGAYSCSCPAGYAPANVNGLPTCAEVNECQGATNPCGYGACTNTPGSYQCACQAGYTFSNGTCVDVNECNGTQNPCGVGSCSNGQGNYTCNCPSGYQLTQGASGPTCTDINECTSNPSLCAPGTCANNAGSFSCTCGNGYRLSQDGRSCTNIDECAESQFLCATGAGARPAGQCVDTPGSFYCSCPSGFAAAAGNQSCVDVDECATPGRCGAGQFCVNTIGSYTCNSCPSGQTPSGGGCIDLNECTAGSQNPCGAMVGAQCTNLVNTGYSCSCPSGYVSSGGANPTCVDVNECSTNNGGCAQNCQNTQGGFTCSCNTGFQLGSDGKSCNDVNECLANNGGCSQYAACANTIGSRTCTCQNGYSGDGVTCADVDECTTNTTICGASSSVGTCSNTAGSYSCTCGAGYQFRSGTCVNVDECSSGTNPCGAGACNDQQGTYTCSCNAGYQSTNAAGGPTCTDINECSTNNGGCAQVCNNSGGSYACACNTWYQLAADQKSCNDINECGANNGGCSPYATCANNVGAAPTCTCQSGYSGSGTTCTDVDECATTPPICVDRRCSNSAGSHTCIDDCQPNPCGVGSCAMAGGSYACTCPSGYQIGTNASGKPTCVDVNECTANTDNCSPFATCSNTTGSFTCACDTNNGWVGDGVTCHKPTKLAMGSNHQCVLLAANSAHGAKVLCWGANGSGQLGTGNTTPLAAPTFSKPVLQASGWEPYDIAAGDEFTCGLARNAQGAGGVFCWGKNGFGQLGRGGGPTFSGVPEQVKMADGQGVPAGNAGSLSLGVAHACVIGNDPIAAYCWGNNSWGQLGIGTTTSQGVATKMVYVTPPIGQSLSVFRHREVAALDANTCFIVDRTVGSTTTRHVTCVGRAGTDRVLPNPGAPSSQAGGTGDCATTDPSTGAVTYGCATEPGGLLTFPSSYPPTDGLACGSNHCLVMNLTSGERRVLGWGKNASGQLSQSSYTFQAQPALSNSGYIASGHTIRALAAGGDTSYAVLTDNGLSGAGEGDQGQQFNGGLNDSPNFGSRGAGILSIFAGRGAALSGSTSPGTRACVIRGNSDLWCGGGFADPVSLGRTDCTAGACTSSNAYFRTIPWVQ
jgi:hypothetical protein